MKKKSSWVGKQVLAGKSPQPVQQPSVPPGATQKGRLVWNHSTHLPGLIPVLERLTQVPGIGTVTPAVIGSTRSNIPTLTIKISVPICGGYKLIARKGKTFQEVFVLTDLGSEALDGAIAQSLRK